LVFLTNALFSILDAYRLYFASFCTMQAANLL